MRCVGVVFSYKGEVPVPATPQRWHHTASRILLGFAAVMLALIMVLRLPWIASEVPLAYNEGWNAYHAAAVRDGTTLYPSLAETGTVNNYPPISFLAIGTIARAGGDPIRIGRIVNLIGLLMTVVAMVGLVRRLGGGRSREATLFTIVVTLFPFLVPWHIYLGIDDPQMIAHGVMLGAALLIVRAEGSEGATAGGAALMAVAGFTKHNLLPLPIAMLVWLALSGQRRAAWAFLAGGLGTAAVLVAGAYITWGKVFFESLLLAPRVTRWDRIPEIVRRELTMLTPLIVLAGWLVVRSRPHRLVAAYFWCSLVLCVLSFAGEGVASSGVFDLGLAMAMVVAIVLGRAEAHLPASLSLQVTRILVLGFIGFASTQGARSEVWLARNRTLAEERRMQHATVAWLQGTAGDAACELLVTCFQAGKRFVWDPFNVGQAIKLGHPAGDRFLSEVANRRVAAFVLSRWPDVSKDQVPPALIEALTANYREADWRLGPQRTVLVPK